MVKKPPESRKKFFSFFYNLFHIFPLPLRKKTKPHTFFPLFITGNRKTARENVLLKKFFFLFFFFFFSTLPLFVIRKITTYLFFRNSHLKCPKMPISVLKFHFFTNYLFFRRDYADTYTYPHTLRFSDP